MRMRVDLCNHRTASPVDRRRAYAAVGLKASSFARRWPVKPVRWIVPFASGGTMDVRARWGQPMIHGLPQVMGTICAGRLRKA
jgi:tripartite-type tricarboxylate transporter receptor subunit TctC